MASRRSSCDISNMSTPLLPSSSSSRRSSCDYSGHVFSSRDKIEKYAQVFTGSQTLNNLYGSVLSKSLRFRHEKGMMSDKFNAQEVYPNMFVGDVYAAHNSAELKKRGITHIVNCVPGVKPAFSEEFKYLYIPMLDCATEAICEQFNASFDFIHSALCNNGRVLVHCLQGMSRSATIATAYVMKVMHISAQEAVSILQSKRDIIRPNYGFMIQLERYQEEMRQEKEVQHQQHQQQQAEISAGKSSQPIRRASI